MQDYTALTYNEDFEKQIEGIQPQHPIRTLKKYFLSGETWGVNKFNRLFSQEFVRQ